MPVSIWLYPCNFLWNGNQKKIKGNFSITNQECILKFFDWFNIHWLHSELQTIIYTDLSLAALSTCLSCLSLSLLSLFSCSAFNLSSSSSFSFLFCSTLLKNQVTLLNKLSRKSFASSHYKLHIMGYRITYLTCNSASLLLLNASLLLLLLSLKCQEIVSVKYSFIVQVYCENSFTFQIQLEDEICKFT